MYITYHCYYESLSFQHNSLDFQINLTSVEQIMAKLIPVQSKTLWPKIRRLAYCILNVKKLP